MEIFIFFIISWYFDNFFGRIFIDVINIVEFVVIF